MARGRMITNAICKDKKVDDLSDDTCRLMFTWLITFADREGRTYGDAAVVRSMVFPRREISVSRMEEYLQELNDAGLIVRYECDGDYFIWFPKFDKNQPGIRKDRESPSELPPPPSGTTPELLRIDAGLKEEKLKEEKLKEEPLLPVFTSSGDSAFTIYENEIGPLTKWTSDSIGDAIDDFTEAWVIDAIHEAVTHNARNWKYIVTILKRWKKDGRIDKRTPTAQKRILYDPAGNPVEVD